MANVADELVLLNTRVAQLLAGVQISRELLDSVSPNAIQVAEDAEAVADSRAIIEAAEAVVTASEQVVLAAEVSAKAARDHALTAAEISGDVRFFATFEEASEELNDLPEDQIVRILVDGTKENRQSFYRKETGVLVWKSFDFIGVTYATQPIAEAGLVDYEVMTPFTTRKAIDYRAVYKQPNGLVGNGIADDTVALQAAFNALPNGGFLVIPPGTYKAHDLLIQNKQNVTVICYGKILRPDGLGTDGVKIKGCYFSRFHFANIETGRTTNPANWADLIGSAISIESNTNNCEVILDHTRGFENAILCLDTDGGGVYFVTTKVGRARHTRYGTHWKVQDGIVGFVNGNTHSFGDFRGYTAIKSTKGSAQTDPFNGNHIINYNTEEAAGDAINIEFAAANEFSHMRFEPSPIIGFWIKTSATCYGNSFYVGSLPLSKLSMRGYSESVHGMLTGGGGAPLGHMLTSGKLPATKLVILGFADTGSMVYTADGIPVEMFALGAYVDANSAQDQGISMVTHITAPGTAGRKRALLQKNGTGEAINVDLALPYNVSHVRVQTNTAAVKLLLKTSDYFEGNTFFVNVTNYVNALTIRNQADTGTVTAGINAVGLWLVMINAGFGVTVVKLN